MGCAIYHSHPKGPATHPKQIWMNLHILGLYP
jgi:hypothetical protein